MAELYFGTSCEYEELKKLGTEIDRLQTKLKSFKPGDSDIAMRATEAQLRTATKRFKELADAAAQAGASMNMNISQGANAAMNQINKLYNTLSNPIVGITSIAGLAAMDSFLGKITNIRSQFQGMESAIDTLVGEKKGDKLMAELKEFAKISPLDFKGTVGGAQMMLGYGIEPEKVTRYLSALSDVSMGRRQSFESLKLAFSQMSAAGKLMGQDLNQMVNAGFNPLQTMAEKTGKSITALKKEMSDGKISAAMVQQAFLDATSEGGKYYKMSEKASSTITGQMSMLEDASDLMFNEMGENIEGVLTKLISGATTIIENWKTVGGVVATAIATYGVYKTTAMASEFADKKAAEERATSIVEGFRRQEEAVKNYEAVKRAECARSAKTDSGSDNQTNSEGESDKPLVERPDDVITKVTAGQALTEDDSARLEAYAIQLADQRIEKAKEIQRLKREELETEQKRLQEAPQIEKEIAARTQIVESLKEEVRQRREMDELDGKDSDSDSTLEKVKELAEAEEALKSVRDNYQPANKIAENIGNIEQAIQNAVTEENSATTDRNTLSQQANAFANRANAQSRMQSAAAGTAAETTTKRHTLASIHNTMSVRFNAAANHLLAAAQKKVRDGLNAIKTAWATNPLGLIATVLTTVGGMLWTYFSHTDEAKESTKRFGIEADKTTKEVNLLYSVLSATDAGSQIHKQTLEKLARVAKDYGLTLDDEKDKYAQLISLKEQMIGLIQEEARQRQIAESINKIQEDGEGKKQDAKEGIGRAVKRANKDGDEEEVNAYSEDVGQVVSETIDSNITKAEEVYNRVMEARNKLHEAINTGKGDKAALNKDLMDAMAEFDKFFLTSGNKIISDFGGNKISVNNGSGVVDSAIFGYVGSMIKNKNLTDTRINALTEARAKSEAYTDANKSPKEPYSTEGKDDSTLATDLENAKKNISTLTPELETANKAAKDADDAFVALGGSLDNVGNKEVKPSVDSSGAEKLDKTAKDAGASVGKLNTTVTATVKAGTYDKFNSTVKEIYTYLAKFTNLLGIGKEEQKNAAANARQAAQKAAKDKADELARAQAQEKAAFEDLIDISNVVDDKSYKTKKAALAKAKELYKWNEKQYKQIQAAETALEKKKQATQPDKSAVERQFRKEEQARKEALRLEELAFEKSIKLRELHNARERNLAKKGVEQMKIDYDKKMHELKKALQKEADTLEQNDVDKWVNSGKDRTKAKYYAQFSDSQIDNMRKGYLQQANVNLDGDLRTQEVVQGVTKSAFDMIDKKRIELANDPYTEAMNEIYQNRGTMLKGLEYQEADILRRYQDKKIADAAKEGKTLERESITLDDLSKESGAEYAEFNDLLKYIVLARKTIEQSTALAQKNALKDLLGDYATYEQQKQFIAEKYQKEREKFYKKDEKGNVIRDGNDNPILIEGVNQANIKAVNDKETEELNNLRENYLGDFLSGNARKAKTREEFERKRENLYEHDANGERVKDENGNDKFKVGADQSSLNEVNKQEKAAIDEIAIQMASRQQVFQGWCNQIANWSLEQLGYALSKAEEQIKEFRNEDGTLRKDLTPAQVEQAELLQGQIAQLKKNAKDASDNIDGIKIANSQLSPKQKFLNSWPKLSESIGKSAQAIRGFAGAFDETTNAVINSVAEITELTVGAVDAITQFAQSSSDATKKAAEGTSKAMQGMQKGIVILQVLSTAFQIYQKIMDFNRQASEKRVKELDKQIDDSKRRYDELGKAASRAYSKDKSELIAQQNKELESQILLVRQQLAEKQKVKHKSESDKDAIRDYQQKLQDLRTQISDNKLAMQDAIFGQDIASQISSFADAYASMFDAGMTRARSAKNLVKTMIKGMVMEMLKADLKEPMQRLRNMMETYWADNVIDAAEETALQNYALEVMDKEARKWGSMNRYFKDTEEQQATAGGFETMSQDSADQLSGRFAAMQISANAIQAQVLRTGMSVASINEKLLQMSLNDTQRMEYQDSLNRMLANMNMELQTISANTGAVIKPIQQTSKYVEEIYYITKKL